MPVRRFTGSGSGGRLSARMARVCSLEFFSSLSFLSALNMWSLDLVQKHCLNRPTVDAEADDRSAGREKD